MNTPTRIATWAGGIALLSATAIDTVAVIGRHVGFPLLGSIELMQGVVLVSGALGLVIATAAQSHARVQLLVDRLPASLRGVADRGSDAMNFLFFLALLVGSVWISIDLWDAHERSELLGVPWRMLRLFANLCLLCACLIAFWRVFRRAEP